MPFTPAPPFPKTQGQVIRSRDWNDLVIETQRLDTDKVNKAGDTMTGPLTIEGNVGIFMTNPQARLEINGGPPWTLQSWKKSLKIQDTNAIEFDSASVKYGIGASSSGNALYFFKTTSEGDDQPAEYKMIIRDSGNIGIGTTTPDSKLHVSGGEGDILSVDRGSTSVKLAIGYTHSSTDMYLGTVTQHNLRFKTANQDRMAITADGNVGIGTTSPEAKLDVNGDFRVREASSVGNIHLFLANEYKTLWSNKGGGEHINDVSNFVPPTAKGAVIKVIVNAGSVKTGSFVCADRKGNFGSVAHYYQNGFTNYLDTWVGGMVLCPFYSGKKFKWRMDSNTGTNDNRVKSYAGLIGWF